MLRSFLIRWTLLCYSAIALLGPGLHLWLEGETCGGCQHHACAHDEHDDHDADHEHAPVHDCNDCVVCHHFAVGQIFQLSTPLAAVEPLRVFGPPTDVPLPAAVEVASPAQPRAPPIA